MVMVWCSCWGVFYDGTRLGCGDEGERDGAVVVCVLMRALAGTASLF
jgi:hypothetical protein